MTRICFLGNSHLACLKLAAARDPHLVPGERAAWFAGSASSMNGLKLENGQHLVPRGDRLKAQMAAISGGIDRVDLTAYDLFVIVGINLDYRILFGLFGTHCLASDVAQGRQAGRAPVSASLFRAYLADIYATRPGKRIAHQIRAVNPAARVMILPAPYPSETILDHEAASRALSGFKGSDCFAEMAEIHLAAATRAAAAAGAELVPQDPATLASPGFTMARYNTRAIGLQSPHRAHAENWHGEKSAYDPWHMNADLGRARLLDLARALGAAPLAASA
jgi:hypothetical protein